MWPAPTERRGFTLIELLVALAILSLLSALTYRAVAGVFDAERQIRETGRQWQDLSLFFEQFEQDAIHAIERSIRDNRGDSLPEFLLRSAEGEETQSRIEWTRLGDSSVRNPDSRRIGYRVRDGKLEYLQWPVLDRAPTTEPRVIAVLDHVKSLRLRCLSQNGRWLEIWPITGLGDRLPRAVDISVELEGGITVRRLITLGAT